MLTGQVAVSSLCWKLRFTVPINDVTELTTLIHHSSLTRCRKHECSWLVGYCGATAARRGSAAARPAVLQLAGAVFAARTAVGRHETGPQLARAAKVSACGNSFISRTFLYILRTSWSSPLQILPKNRHLKVTHNYPWLAVTGSYVRLSFLR